LLDFIHFFATKKIFSVRLFLPLIVFVLRQKKKREMKRER